MKKYWRTLLVLPIFILIKIIRGIKLDCCPRFCPASFAVLLKKKKTHTLNTLKIPKPISIFPFLFKIFEALTFDERSEYINIFY